MLLCLRPRKCFRHLFLRTPPVSSAINSKWCESGVGILRCGRRVLTPTLFHSARRRKRREPANFVSTTSATSARSSYRCANNAKASHHRFQNTSLPPKKSPPNVQKDAAQHPAHLDHTLQWQKSCVTHDGRTTNIIFKKHSLVVCTLNCTKSTVHILQKQMPRRVCCSDKLVLLSWGGT